MNNLIQTTAILGLYGEKEMLTIYKCSGKNWQWTTSVEDTV